MVVLSNCCLLPAYHSSLFCPQYVYINHETKATQWEHPLNPNAKQHRRQQRTRTAAASSVDGPDSPKGGEAN